MPGGFNCNRSASASLVWLYFIADSTPIAENCIFPLTRILVDDLFVSEWQFKLRFVSSFYVLQAAAGLADVMAATAL